MANRCALYLTGQPGTRPRAGVPQTGGIRGSCACAYVPSTNIGAQHSLRRRVAVAAGNGVTGGVTSEVLPLQTGLNSLASSVAEQQMVDVEVDQLRARLDATLASTSASTLEEVHVDDSIAIQVIQLPESLCAIQASVALRMPARLVYKQIITHPGNASIFRHLKTSSESRQVVQDNGQGCRTLRVAQEGHWRFLLFKGSFVTRLLVTEEDSQLRVDFRLDDSPAASADAGAGNDSRAANAGSPGLAGTDQPGGAMIRSFVGQWVVEPHPEDPLHASLVTLKQEIAVNVTFPPPFDGAFKTICCNKLRAVLEDVQTEVTNYNAGRAKLSPWEQASL